MMTTLNEVKIEEVTANIALSEREFCVLQLSGIRQFCYTDEGNVMRDEDGNLIETGYIKYHGWNMKNAKLTLDSQKAFIVRTKLNALRSVSVERSDKSVATRLINKIDEAFAKEAEAAINQRKAAIRQLRREAARINYTMSKDYTVEARSRHFKLNSEDGWSSTEVELETSVVEGRPVVRWVATNGWMKDSDTRYEVLEEALEAAADLLVARIREREAEVRLDAQAAIDELTAAGLSLTEEN